MPDWLATMLGAFVGGLAALTGVWLQIRTQRSAEEARLRAQREAEAAQERDERAQTLGVALAVLDQYAPQRITARIAKGEGITSVEALGDWIPVRDRLAEIAARDPASADRILLMMDAVSEYIDTVPNLSHWIGDEPQIKRLVSEDDTEARFRLARDRLRELLTIVPGPGSARETTRSDRIGPP
jgi:hypothetical protein